MKNGNATSYLYHFYRKERRGLVQARPGKGAERIQLLSGGNRF